MSAYLSLPNSELSDSKQSNPKPSAHEPSAAHLALVTSLVASQPVRRSNTSDSFLAVGRQTSGLGWSWSRVATETNVAPDVTIASQVKRLHKPPGCTAVGLVSQATARRLDAPNAPGIPVMVAYVVTESAGSVSLLLYPDGQSIWSTSPTGALADAAASLFRSDAAVQPDAAGKSDAAPDANSSASAVRD